MNLVHGLIFPHQAGGETCRVGLEFSPTKLLQIDPPLPGDPHTFPPEEYLLQVIPTGRPPADPSLRVHHPMPWDVVPARAQRPSDRARGPGISQGARDRPVGGDAARWDSANQGVDAGEEGRGRSSDRHDQRDERKKSPRAVVELVGIEPTASSTPKRRSPAELQPHVEPRHRIIADSSGENNDRRPRGFNARRPPHPPTAAPDRSTRARTARRCG